MGDVELSKKTAVTVVDQVDIAPSAAQVDNFPAASLGEMFQNATSYDYLLMFLGTLGSVMTGVSIPIFNVLFGQILDKLNGDPQQFADAIAQLCIDFVIVACANLVSGYLQVFLLTVF